MGCGHQKASGKLRKRVRRSPCQKTVHAAEVWRRAPEAHPTERDAEANGTIPETARCREDAKERAAQSNTGDDGETVTRAKTRGSE